MKEKIFVLFIFCSINFSNCLFAQKISDTLFVKNVDFKILTFSSVSCEDFAASFAGRIKFRTIVDKDTIAIFDSFLEKIKYAKKNRSVDIRANLLFKRGDKRQTTICTNGYDVVVDGRLIKTNNEFADFLTILTEQKQYLKK